MQQGIYTEHFRGMKKEGSQKQDGGQSRSLSLDQNEQVKYYSIITNDIVATLKWYVEIYLYNVCLSISYAELTGTTLWRPK